MYFIGTLLASTSTETYTTKSTILSIRKNSTYICRRSFGDCNIHVIDSSTCLIIGDLDASRNVNSHVIWIMEWQVNIHQ